MRSKIFNITMATVCLVAMALSITFTIVNWNKVAKYNNGKSVYINNYGNISDKENYIENYAKIINVQTSEIKRLSDKIQIMNTENANLENEIIILTIHKEQLNSKVNDLDSKIIKITNENEALNLQIINLNNQLSENEEENKKLNAQIETLEDQIVSNEQTISNLETEKSQLNAQITTLNQSISDKETIIANNEAKITDLTTEKNNWLNKYNSAVLEIRNLNAQLDTKSEEIKNLSDQIENCGSEINAKISQINTLENTIKENQATISNLNQAIATKTAELQEKVTEISNLTTQNTTLNNEIIALKDTISQKNSDIAVLNYQITNLTTEKTNLENQVTNLSTQITEKNNQITQLQENAEENAEQIANLEAEVSSLTTEKTQLQATITAKDAQISNLNSQISSLTTEKDNLQSQIDNKNSTIGGNNSLISNLNIGITTLSSEITNNSNSITDLNTSNNSIYTSIETLNSEIDSKQNDLSNLINQLNGVSQEIQVIDGSITFNDGTLYLYQNENEIKSGNSFQFEDINNGITTALYVANSDTTIENFLNSIQCDSSIYSLDFSNYEDYTNLCSGMIVNAHVKYVSYDEIIVPITILVKYDIPEIQDGNILLADGVSNTTTDIKNFSIIIENWQYNRYKTPLKNYLVKAFDTNNSLSLDSSDLKNLYGETSVDFVYKNADNTLNVVYTMQNRIIGTKVYLTGLIPYFEYSGYSVYGENYTTEDNFLLLENNTQVILNNFAYKNYTILVTFPEDGFSDITLTTYYNNTLNIPMPENYSWESCYVNINDTTDWTLVGDARNVVGPLKFEPSENNSYISNAYYNFKNLDKEPVIKFKVKLFKYSEFTVTLSKTFGELKRMVVNTFEFTPTLTFSTRFDEKGNLLCMRINGSYEGIYYKTMAKTAEVSHDNLLRYYDINPESFLNSEYLRNIGVVSQANTTLENGELKEVVVYLNIIKDGIDYEDENFQKAVITKYNRDSFTFSIKFTKTASGSWICEALDDESIISYKVS